MKKTIIIAILFLLLVTLVAAQENGTDSLFEPKLSGMVFETPAGFKGNQYYSTWVKGDILLKSGRHVRNKMLRYNGFLDELIWFDESKGRQVKLDKHFINEFNLRMEDGKVCKFRRFWIAGFLPGDSSDVFFEVLAEGPYSLFVQRKIAIRGSSTQQLEGKQYIFSDLEPLPSYFLMLPDHEIRVFSRISRKNILSILPPEPRETARRLLRDRIKGLRTEAQLLDLVRKMGH